MTPDSAALSYIHTEASLHRSPWFCTSKITGTAPRRPIEATGTLPVVREQMFLYSKEILVAARPIGYSGGHFRIAIPLGNGKQRIGLSARLSLFF